VKQIQFVQKSLDQAIARFVKEGPLEQARLDAIERTVKIVLGNNVQVKFDFPDEIAPQKSAKYLYAISELHDSSEA
jgi:hypothetical protein